jgi:hypothetical protein
MTPSQCYEGPGGVVFTPDELLIIWSCLYRLVNSENAPIRRKIERYLEGRDIAVTGADHHLGEPSQSAH